MPKQPPEVGDVAIAIVSIHCTVDLSMFDAFKSCWLYGLYGYTCNKVEHDRICSRIDGVGIRWRFDIAGFSRAPWCTMFLQTILNKDQYFRIFPAQNTMLSQNLPPLLWKMIPNNWCSGGDGEKPTIAGHATRFAQWILREKKRVLPWILLDI